MSSLGAVDALQRPWRPWGRGSVKAGAEEPPSDECFEAPPTARCLGGRVSRTRLSSGAVLPRMKVTSAKTRGTDLGGRGSDQQSTPAAPAVTCLEPAPSNGAPGTHGEGGHGGLSTDPSTCPPQTPGTGAEPDPLAAGRARGSPGLGVTHPASHDRPLSETRTSLILHRDFRAAPEAPGEVLRPPPRDAPVCLPLFNSSAWELLLEVRFPRMKMREFT